MKFYLDEDLPPSVAVVARGLGLDVTSTHEVSRQGASDEEQLQWAAAEGRILVTRNRDDFIELTRKAFQVGSPHPGVLIVARSLPNRRPESMAHALAEWSRTHEGRGFEGCLDFLSGKRVE